MKKLYRIIVLLIALIFLSTYTPKELQISSQKKNVFFGVKKIEIKNVYLIDKKEIIKKLNQINNKNILFIKKKEIEEPLKSIDFLEKVEVKKIYPGTIIINVFETKPIGILFKNNTKYILDSSSNLVLFKKKMLNDFFPGIFGEDAEKEFVNFFNLLKDNQFPWKEIKNYYYFQIGRWDLQLFSNQTIKLPPNKTADAIQNAIELLNRKDFDNYNIIDLRISGKIVAE